MTDARLSVFAFFALAIGTFVPLDQAAAQQRWCAWYDAYTYNCGFRTFEQCLATISGAGGYCQRDVYGGPQRPPETTGGPRPRSRSRNDGMPAPYGGGPSGY